MPLVEVNNLILTPGPSITSGTPMGTTFTHSADPDESGLLDVVQRALFQIEDNQFGNIIPLGAIAKIDGSQYTLTGISEFWGTYTKVDPDTGELFTQSGQTVALTVEAADGTVLNFLVPSDRFNQNDPWAPGEIQSIAVSSTPTEGDFIGTTPGTEDSKLSSDNDVKIPCFVAGTLIDTADGRKAVEDLRAGDLVLTRDHGYLPLSWVGQRSISAEELYGHADYAPVLLRAGSLGLNTPEVDTRVSPAHRVLICGPRAELLFGEKEVLVPAGHLVGQPGIERDMRPVVYVHIMFDSHQIVLGDGLWSESFQPADHSMEGLGAEQRDEILGLFPELAGKAGQTGFRAARMTLKAHEARLLFAA